MKTNTENANIKIGSFLTYILMGISICNTLFLTPFLLNVVGKSDYGLYSLSLSITSWVSVITNALAASFIRFATIEKQNNGNVNRTNTLYFKLLLYFSLSIIILFFLVFVPISFATKSIGNYQGSDFYKLVLLLIFSLANSFVTIVFSVYTLYLNFKRKFIFVKALACFILILTILSKFIFLLTFNNIVAMVVVDLAMSILSGLVTMVVAIKKEGFGFGKNESLRKNKQTIKSIISFTSIILLYVFAEQINLNLDKTILGFLSNSINVANYQLSYTFCHYLTTIPIAIATFFIPRINELVIKDKQNELNQLFLKVCKIQTIIVFAILGGFFVCGKYFVCIWLGNENDYIYYYALVLMIVHSIPITLNLAIEIERARNKHKFRAFCTLITALSNALFTTLFVWIFNDELSVWVCIICTAVSTIVGVWILIPIYDYKTLKLPIGRNLSNAIDTFTISALCSVGSVIFLEKINSYYSLNNYLMFAVGGLFFIILYFLLIFLLDRDSLPFFKHKVNYEK